MATKPQKKPAPGSKGTVLEVHKFGGASLADASSYRHAVDIIIEADGFEPRRVRFLLSKTETRELAIVLQRTGAAAGSR